MTPIPEQLKAWRTVFLSEDGYTPEVPIPDAHNYKRVLQDARFTGYLRAKQESQTMTEPTQIEKQYAIEAVKAADFGETWLVTANRALAIQNEAYKTICGVEANAQQDTDDDAAFLKRVDENVAQFVAATFQKDNLISADEARQLGAGNAEWLDPVSDNWYVCGRHNGYKTHEGVFNYKYRAIKPQAQPEPEGLTSKEAWWAGARAGLGLPANTPRTDVAKQIPKTGENKCTNGTPNILQSQPTTADADCTQMQDDTSNAHGARAVHIKEESCLEPVDPHAALRAEYARQRDAVPCELGFYLWEYKGEGDWFAEKPQWWSQFQYRCTDISCYVSKDGEPAIRMLRTEAQELQRKTKDTHDWFDATGLKSVDYIFRFDVIGTYTYRTKAIIKLDGKMVTREQALAEWESKKETCDIWCAVEFAPEFELQSGVIWRAYSDQKFEFELRPKPAKVVAWTGSRDDVIALLKELELLK